MFEVSLWNSKNLLHLRLGPLHESCWPGGCRYRKQHAAGLTIRRRSDGFGVQTSEAVLESTALVTETAVNTGLPLAHARESVDAFGIAIELQEGSLTSQVTVAEEHNRSRGHLHDDAVLRDLLRAIGIARGTKSVLLESTLPGYDEVPGPEDSLRISVDVVRIELVYHLHCHGFIPCPLFVSWMPSQ